jgi:outer membrane immunogenic protein
MNKYVLAATALFAMGGTSLAADIAAEPTPYDWSGMYAGVIAGYSWSDFDVNADQPNTPAFDLSQSFGVEGGQVGLEAGWNHQIDSLVFGIAADISLSDAEDPSNIDTVFEDELYVGKHDYFATVRGRLGYAMDNVLVYATGGLAITDAEFRYENYSDSTHTVLDQPIVKDHKTLLGWTAGGGVELALGETVSVKAEYLYSDFGSLDFDFIPGDLTGDADVTSHIVRAGLLIHF